MSSNPGNTASQSSVLRRIEALHEELRTSRRRTNERLDGLQSSFDELKRDVIAVEELQEQLRL